MRRGRAKAPCMSPISRFVIDRFRARRGGASPDLRKNPARFPAPRDNRDRAAFSPYWEGRQVTKGSSPILYLIRRLVIDPGVRCCPDKELLQRFLDQQDEAAFDTLVRRHGPLVVDACRSVLFNEAD